jgi:hypothetical protein
VAILETFHNPIHTPWWWGDQFAPPGEVPWELPVAINDHGYVMDFAKSRITTLQVRRQSADDSVEPGEQTLSVAGVWPRAQDNWFVGSGQEFLDNRFAFESVYVHSGEYPSVRTRFWRSFGVNPWNEGKLILHNEYQPIAASDIAMQIVVCGDYLYYSDGPSLFWTFRPDLNVPTPAWTAVTMANTQNVVSLTSDGYQVWAACGTDGVFNTIGGSTTSTQASTPAALAGVGGLIAAAAGAGTIGSHLVAGSHTYEVSEVDAFGNETQTASATVTVTTTPVNLTWNPDQHASDFNVYVDGAFLSSTDGVPAFVDDGTIAPDGTRTPPVANATGATAYAAVLVGYAKGHLVASTGADLVEILASGDVSFIFQHANPLFRFRTICECPSAILVGGSAGGVSFIGAVQPDATNDGATLAPPIWATTLDPGEDVYAMAYAAGAMLLGTSLGIREGTRPDANGVFDINPVVEDPGPVYAVAPWLQYEYFGWSNYAPASPWAPTRPVISGIGRADLSQFSTPGVPAYATDVMGQTPGITTAVVVVAGDPYFVVNDEGAFSLYGPSGLVVESGWLEAGWVRYGTLEKKILVEVDFQHKPLPEGSSVTYQTVSEDELTVVSEAVNDVTGSTTVNTPIPLGLAVGDRFLPIITLTAAADQRSGPVFLSHITKAMVVTQRQDECLIALVFKERAYGLGPAQKVKYLNVLDEYVYLKQLEWAGEVVQFTLGGWTRNAYIDQVMLEPSETDAVTSLHDWVMGTVTVKLVTLDNTVPAGT